jgi:hypothetical protein
MHSPQSRAQARGREKQADESCLQQHAIGLVAREVLRCADKRKKTNEADCQHPARPEVQHQKKRGCHACPTNSVQHHRPARPPKHARRIPHSLPVTEGLSHCLKIVSGRKNSLRANESANLEEKREEGREVDRAQATEESPPRKQSARSCSRRIKEPFDRRYRGTSHDPALYEEGTLG